MAVIEINWNPTRKQLNRFGFVWLSFLAVFGAVAYFKLHIRTTAFALWALAVVVPVIGWVMPRFMRVVFVGMSCLAWPIGFVVSHVVLAVVFYLVVTPIGLLMRLSGYDPMRRRFETGESSYWIRRQETGVDTERYFRQS